MKFKNDDNVLASWGCFFLGLAIIFWTIGLPGCKTAVPAIDVSFWAGDSTQGGVSRKQENKTIPCNAPEFDEYVCLTYQDVQKIWDTLLQCQQWPQIQLASQKDLKRFSKKNPEVYTYVRSKQR